MSRVITARVVVMFAYHYPPENVIGAARPYRFQKYLSRLGYRCEVFTAAKQTRDLDSHVQYIADPFPARKQSSLGWQLERGVRKLFFPGAVGFQWSLRASRAAGSFLSSTQNAEVTIYSTFPPVGSHLAALRLTRNRRWRWIADFRDPLLNSGNPHGHNRTQRKAHSMFEKAVLARADAVIVSNDAQARHWKTVYPDLENRIHVIWNGFDPEDGTDECELPKRDFQLISHVGALYGGRSIKPLLESMARLVASGRLRDRIRIRLVGPISPDCVPKAEFLERAKGEGWLEIIPDQVPALEARRLAQESNALLLIQPHSTVQVPGKLFEYLRLQRPVLAFVLPGSPIEDLLRRSGATYQCVYANGTPEEIDSSVEPFLRQENGKSETNAWFSEKFNGKKQAEELSMLIQSIHGVGKQVVPADARAVAQINK